MSDASASESHDDDPQTTGSDPRYASQAAAAEPAPVALEGGASEPGGGGGGTTGRSEWLFLVLAVFFTLALVSIPAVFFTSIDLTATAEVSGGGVSDGSEGALERERLQLLQETRSAALAKLSAYGPVDDAGGNGDRAYRIPLDRAMRLTLRDEYAAAAASGASATFPAGGRGLKVVVPGDAPAPDAPASDSSARR
jgi:hypothetical protein